MSFSILLSLTAKLMPVINRMSPAALLSFRYPSLYAYLDVY